MYSALCALLVGIFVGHILSGKVPFRLISGGLFLGVLGLLFLLGAQIGANERLFAALPQLGTTAAILAAGAMAGSILFAMLLAKVKKP